MAFIIPIIKYNDYNEIIYDKNKYNVKKTEELIIGDVIVVRDNIGKIIKKSASHTGKHGKIKFFFECVGVFNNNKYDDIIPDNFIIFLPILKFTIFTFVNMTDKLIELYNDSTNEILEIIICKPMDNQIIKNITDKKNETIEIQVVQFENLNRIIGVL